MQVTQESIVDQLVTVHVVIEADDYLPKVEEQLKKIRREASIPGFRVGHVPKTLIDKRFKKNVTVETVFKEAQESFGNYIDNAEREYNIIGTPALTKLPEETEMTTDQPLTFTFTTYIVPKVDLSTIKNQSVQDYTVEVDPDLIDNYFLSKAIECFPFEPLKEEEVITDGKAYRIFPLIKSGEQEISTNHSSAIILTPLYPEIAQPFIGKKQGDVIEIDKKTFVDYSYQMHTGLHLLDNKVETDTVIIELKYIDQYSWEENYIEKMFEKYYPEAEDKTETNLRKLVCDDIEKDLKSWVHDYQINYQIPNLLRNLFDLPIPPAGLIQELKQQHQNEKEESTYIPTQEEIESSTKMYKLRYLYKQFMTENNISVEQEELDKHIEQSIAEMYRGNVNEELIQSMKQYFYNNESMFNRTYYQALNKKLMDSIAQQVQFSTPQQITYIDFMTLLNTRE